MKKHMSRAKTVTESTFQVTASIRDEQGILRRCPQQVTLILCCQSEVDTEQPYLTLTQPQEPLDSPLILLPISDIAKAVISTLLAFLYDSDPNTPRVALSFLDPSGVEALRGAMVLSDVDVMDQRDPHLERVALTQGKPVSKPVSGDDIRSNIISILNDPGFGDFVDEVEQILVQMAKGQ
eukprot:gnl/Dysnectes_brevis/2060_a2381_1961.p1 GENE.gnl/Dysnectes_brevis/2060_a2381_1961~~gnl/Dysnectes_brevis/2060_a2381_1961.p1  ORF type:complete len:180 (-),score=25.08 gnl/Dysnectes_brevis/2060_a2381_1961:26-565(-)